MRTYKSDAVVIGGGLAGICAALELLEAGRSVTILDRDEEENFGGLAKESFGGIFVVGSREQKKNGIEDSPARAFADWCSFAEFGPDVHCERPSAETYTGRCHMSCSGSKRRRIFSGRPSTSDSSATRPKRQRRRPCTWIRKTS